MKDEGGRIGRVVVVGGGLGRRVGENLPSCGHWLARSQWHAGTARTGTGWQAASGTREEETPDGVTTNEELELGVD